ncbi:centromere/kinetochore protein zw10 homolog [Branchiostoma floridae]|uniref:Centromere/kinetochore protein zw10 homolog n=1 Tax=Branchiostoma floridae TaxID=7739 RepID=A0A9J7NBU7_BRAFL|nr:centromere/kinetochore protein zw10 homolog [Branchiostoma floridae]
MSSFVTEVLATTGRLEKDDLVKKTSKLSKRVEDIKGEIYETVTQRYGDFVPSMNTTLDLTARVNGLVTEVDNLNNKIQNEVQAQLSTSTSEFQDLQSQLRRTNTVLAVLGRLYDIQQALDSHHNDMDSQQFISAAARLTQIEQIMEELQEDGYCELKILSALGIELRVRKENLIHTLGEAWARAVVWNIPRPKDLSDEDRLLKTELRLTTVTADDATLPGTPRMTTLVRAMADMNVLREKMKVFARRCLEYVFLPLVVLPNVSPKTVTMMQSEALHFDKQSSGKDVTIAPADLYRKIETVLQYFNKHLLGIDVGAPDNSLMSMFSDFLWEDLSQAVIKGCLVHSIPRTSQELERYMEVISATEEFVSSLENLGFLHGEDSALMRYVKEINVHFANKKCQDILAFARDLMTSEMLDTVQVGTSDDAPALPNIRELLGQQSSKKTKSKQDETTTASFEATFDSMPELQCPFRLPVCRISVTVDKLVKLAYTTLCEACEVTTSNPSCAVQMFYAVRDMLELYMEVVPCYHEENLKKLPHVTAIHYNNCFYIAHHLLTLGHQFLEHLPKALVSSCATFVDQIPVLRELGTECLLQQMRIQRDQVLEYLVGAHNFTNMAEDYNRGNAEKAVKKVLHQLTHLSKVWQDVLPTNIYCKALGSLLNSAIQDIIGKVTALEDISADDAAQLHSLCGIVKERAPLLFHPVVKEDTKNRKAVEAEVQLYVPQWVKFSELMVMLDASLQDIADRWADGKGPLGHEFTAMEVRGLVRALFQNTDRRAAVLAKIKQQ